jgi:chromosome segregation ATPase
VERNIDLKGEIEEVKEKEESEI